MNKSKTIIKSHNKKLIFPIHMSIILGINKQKMLILGTKWKYKFSLTTL